MRHFIAVLTATSMLTVAQPVFADVAQAASLFETLFPRAAERRRNREFRRRQQQLRLFEQRQRALRQRQNAIKRKAQKKRRLASKPAQVKGVQYYTYKPRSLSRVQLTALSKSFQAVKSEQIAANEAALEAKRAEAVREHFDRKRMNLDSFARRAAFTGGVIRTGTGSKMALYDAAPDLKNIRLTARKPIAKAIVAHYRKSPAFMWIDDNGRLNEQGRALTDVLADADNYGLNSADYTLPSTPLGENAVAAAEMEFALTARALRYMYDARHGIVDPNRISGYHDFKKNFSDATKLMASLAAAAGKGEASAALIGSHPKDPAFAKLKSELERLNGLTATAVPPVNIAPGTFMRPGDIDPELENIVEAIRRRANDDIKASHGDVLAQDHSTGEYTPEVVALVRDMQKSLWLKPDGIIGKNTIRSLLKNKKLTSSTKRERVLLAMERLRWHPSHLGNTHVLINQAAYRASLKRNGVEKISMNVVVGKRSNQTYFFHDTIDYVEFNPYWGIPRSILVNEMLPKLRRNASYFDNLGYEVTTVGGRRIASSSVDWWSVGANFPFNVRQPPGPKNALGRLKIMFPNSHSIYMHDTPAKSLFSKPTRAFSHGCVRLEYPEEMAAAVLGTSVDDIENAIAQGENKTRSLQTKMPVYVSYFTAWPKSNGEVGYYADVYGRDAALLKAINAERAVRDRAS